MSDKNPGIILDTPSQVVDYISADRKHPQFILAVNNLYFQNNDSFQEGITRYPSLKFLYEVQSHLSIQERGMLESQPRYRQLIPYTVLTQVGEDGVQRYLPYQRMQGVGEARLAGKVSVGFGGHIDLASVVFTDRSVVDLDATIHSSTERELIEELRVVGDGPLAIGAQYTHHFIVSSATGVDCVHAGIVMAAQVPVGVVLECAEKELQMLPAMTAQELLASDFELESWTRQYLRAVTADRPYASRTAAEYTAAVTAACEYAGMGSAEWNPRFREALKQGGLVLSSTREHGPGYPDSMSYQAPNPMEGSPDPWSIPSFMNWK